MLNEREAAIGSAAATVVALGELWQAAERLEAEGNLQHALYRCTLEGCVCGLDEFTVAMERMRELARGSAQYEVVLHEMVAPTAAVEPRPTEVAEAATRYAEEQPRGATVECYFDESQPLRQPKTTLLGR